MSEWKFQRDGMAAFRFVRCGLDAQTGIASLVYAFDDGPELVRVHRHEAHLNRDGGL